ncbi:MAG: Xaa-Pro peptidase family protein [Lentisphaeria bacterium]
MRKGRFIYADSEKSADMRYALGFMIPDAVLWYEIEGERTVVVRTLEIARARREAKPALRVVGDAELRGKLNLDAGNSNNTAQLLAALSKKHNLDEWEVPYDLPVGIAQSVQKANIAVKPVADFWPERRRKTESEVDAVQEGVGLAQYGLKQALDILTEAEADSQGRLGWRNDYLTSERLRGEINAEIARRGGTASHTIAAPGVQGAFPHCVGHGIIYRNQPIVIDIFPRVDSTGYHGDLTRTVVKGTASAVVRQAFAAVNNARKAAVNVVKPGVAAAKVHAAAAECIKQSGFKTDTRGAEPSGFIHGVGHGLGLEVHEAPRVSPKAETLLEPGNVITIEPGVYYPEWGGVRIEDAVLVTTNGCRNLTTAPIILEI